MQSHIIGTPPEYYPRSKQQNYLNGAEWRKERNEKLKKDQNRLIKFLVHLKINWTIYCHR